MRRSLCNEAQRGKAAETGGPSARRNTLPPLAEDEFYLLDLEGLALERDGERVGEVARVLEYPASVCLEVRFPDGVREIPILEPWVQGIDVEAGVIELGPWDDLPVRD